MGLIRIKPNKNIEMVSFRWKDFVRKVEHHILRTSLLGEEEEDNIKTLFLLSKMRHLHVYIVSFTVENKPTNLTKPLNRDNRYQLNLFTPIGPLKMSFQRCCEDSSWT